MGGNRHELYCLVIELEARLILLVKSVQNLLLIMLCIPSTIFQ